MTIDVVNAHFYCGTAIPELSKRNTNRSEGGLPPSLIRDTLKEYVKVADIDGKDRQTWITEFGWDTLAVYIVNEYEQAAYLQRGYIMGIDAGIDKMFWYWNRDTKSVPNTFFDGCGIFDPNDDPKPAAAAFAAMAKMLPEPKPLGRFDVGEGTLGYLFESKGKLVAAVFKLYEHVQAKPVKIDSGEVFDFLGNSIATKTIDLQIAPTWIIDIDPNETILRGCSVDMNSKSFLRTAAGDTFTSSIKLDLSKVMSKNTVVIAEVPDGWEVVSENIKAKAETTIFDFQIKSSLDTERGFYDILLKVYDGKYVQYFPIEVEVVQAANLKVFPLEGSMDNSMLKVELTNNSFNDKAFVVKPVLPAGWKIEPKIINVDLKGKETVVKEFKLKWMFNYSDKSEAMLQIVGSDGSIIAKEGVIPNKMMIPKVKSIKFDGCLDDWPKTAKLPSWAVGCQGEDANASIYMAYGNDGIYFAFEVEGGLEMDVLPRSFWNSDVLEVVLDTKADSTPRSQYAKTDHQFWICPLVDSKKVYLGRWKRNSEITETQFDIANVPGVSMLRNKGSYIVEVMIPAEAITGFNPNSKELGVNLNLTIFGEKAKREVFWIYDKAHGIMNKPSEIGRVIIK